MIRQAWFSAGRCLGWFDAAKAADLQATAEPRRDGRHHSRRLQILGHDVRLRAIVGVFCGSLVLVCLLALQHFIVIHELLQVVRGFVKHVNGLLPLPTTVRTMSALLRVDLRTGELKQAVWLCGASEKSPFTGNVGEPHAAVSTTNPDVVYTTCTGRLPSRDRGTLVSRTDLSKPQAARESVCSCSLRV